MRLDQILKSRWRVKATTSGNSTIQVNVKFAGRSIPVDISSNSSIEELKSLLLPLTNVLPRGQKLIYKGQVLPDEVSLSFLDITNGSKIMLMATAGLHQGGAPIKKETESLAIGSKVAVPEQKHEKENVSLKKSQLKRWQATGVIALSGCNLMTIPDEVWLCGPSTRVLNISNNSLQEIPNRISCLSSIQRMMLDMNKLSVESISWEGIASLKSLYSLTLTQNGLQALPSALGALTSLKKLDVADNDITCLPVEIGHLTNLEIFSASNNRLHYLPESIGVCVSLAEVDLSSNVLVELPETLGNLKDLKALNLNNNGLRYLPSCLFRLCIQLSSLNLHGTQITNDILRQAEGWDEFDNRRRLKHKKQLDFKVTDSGDFDEGADKNC